MNRVFSPEPSPIGWERVPEGRVREERAGSWPVSRSERNKGLSMNCECRCAGCPPIGSAGASPHQDDVSHRARCGRATLARQREPQPASGSLSAWLATWRLPMNRKMPALNINVLRILRFMAPTRVRDLRFSLPMNRVPSPQPSHRIRMGKGEIFKTDGTTSNTRVSGLLRFEPSNFLRISDFRASDLGFFGRTA
jgi:hypothetical protein